jgi:hypothetical protein
MATIAATEAKRRFGQVFEQAKKELAVLQNYGRNSAVLPDIEEYERRRFEDAHWIRRAEEAVQEGLIGSEETIRLPTEGLKEAEETLAGERGRPSVSQFVSGLEPERYEQVVRRFFEWAENPRPKNSIKMEGSPFYGIAQGEYRIVDDFDSEKIRPGSSGSSDDEVCWQAGRKKS